VRVVLGEKRINLRLSHRLEDVRCVLPMIHEYSSTPNLLCRTLRIRCEPARRITERSTLPRVVRRRAANDDLCALGHQCLACIDQVLWVREHGDGLSVVGTLASFVTRARTVGAAVVGGGEGAAVVVAEFNDDDVVGLDQLDDFVKAVFDGEGAGAAAADGLVDHGEGDGVGEVNAPAFREC